MTEQVTTRRLRVVKYRGSTHGTNEYPFLIGEARNLGTPHHGQSSRLSRLHRARPDRHRSRSIEMLDGKGYFRGSSVLVSGTAGTGKSSVAASFVAAAAARGERCLYFALEEPSRTGLRNMRSIGLSLSPLIERGQLQISAARPTLFGLEQHLVAVHLASREFRPTAVVIDPISSLVQRAVHAKSSRSSFASLTI